MHGSSTKGILDEQKNSQGKILSVRDKLEQHAIMSSKMHQVTSAESSKSRGNTNPLRNESVRKMQSSSSINKDATRETSGEVYGNIGESYDVDSSLHVIKPPTQIKLVSKLTKANQQSIVMRDPKNLFMRYGSRGIRHQSVHPSADHSQNLIDIIEGDSTLMRPTANKSGIFNHSSVSVQSRVPLAFATQHQQMLPNQNKLLVNKRTRNPDFNTHYTSEFFNSRKTQQSLKSNKNSVFVLNSRNQNQVDVRSNRAARLNLVTPGVVNQGGGPMQFSLTKTVNHKMNIACTFNAKRSNTRQKSRTSVFYESSGHYSPERL